MTHLLVRYHSIKATSYFLPGIFSSAYSCADRDKNSAWRAKNAKEVLKWTWTYLPCTVRSQGWSRFLVIVFQRKVCGKLWIFFINKLKQTHHSVTYWGEILLAVHHPNGCPPTAPLQANGGTGLIPWSGRTTGHSFSLLFSVSTLLKTPFKFFTSYWVNLLSCHFL